jgi:hypothetical protein
MKMRFVGMEAADRRPSDPGSAAFSPFIASSNLLELLHTTFNISAPADVDTARATAREGSLPPNPVNLFTFTFNITQEVEEESEDGADGGAEEQPPARSVGGGRKGKDRSGGRRQWRDFHAHQ